MSARQLVSGGMRVKAYTVLQRCVDEGVAYGWQRAHKHTDTPDVDHIKEQIENAVLNSVCEYFTFSEDE